MQRIIVQLTNIYISPNLGTQVLKAIWSLDQEKIHKRNDVSESLCVDATGLRQT